MAEPSQSKTVCVCVCPPHSTTAAAEHDVIAPPGPMARRHVTREPHTLHSNPSGAGGGKTFSRERPRPWGGVHTSGVLVPCWVGCRDPPGYGGGSPSGGGVSRVGFPWAERGLVVPPAKRPGVEEVGGVRL